jgi:hypothetical protein
VKSQKNPSKNDKVNPTISKSSDHEPKDASEPLEEYSALADRFSQILEQKISNSSPSMINSDPTLNKLFNKYHNSMDSSASTYLKSEPLLSSNRHAKQIYESTPWKGTESTVDANLRMIIDSKPKMKRVPKKNIHDIKEQALDYKLNEKSTDSATDNFREMYKERLMGPSMFISDGPSSAVDLIGSVAAAKINAHIDQSTGTFKSSEMELIRGKPLSKRHLENCTDSNYFMNQILNTQEILPPWIESQQNLAGQIDLLRRDIDKTWFNWFINKSAMSNQFYSPSANSETSIPPLLEKFHAKFTSNVIYTLHETDTEYIGERIKKLNDSIRTYNLQCPSSHLHKFKLVPETEIKRSYLRTIKDFDSKFEEWFSKNKIKRSTNNIIVQERSGPGFLDLFGSGGSSTSKADEEATIEVPVKQIDTKLHIWKAIKDAFSK